MERTRLDIEGMHCDGCAARLQTLLAKEPGVCEARVSFTEGSAEIRYNPHRVDETRLREIVATAGFRVVERHSHAVAQSTS